MAAPQELLQHLFQSEKHESQKKQPNKPENIQPTKDHPSTSENVVSEEPHKPELVQSTKVTTHESEESHMSESVQHKEVVQSEQYAHNTDSNIRESTPSSISEGVKET